MPADGRSSSRWRPEDGAAFVALVLVDVDFLRALLRLLLLLLPVLLVSLVPALGVLLSVERCSVRCDFPGVKPPVDVRKRDYSY